MEANNVNDSQLNVIAIQSGVPSDLHSCHTAKVAGYIVEWHVPAADIQRMLKEKPAIAGIAVAGIRRPPEDVRSPLSGVRTTRRSPVRRTWPSAGGRLARGFLVFAPDFAVRCDVPDDCPPIS